MNDNEQCQQRVHTGKWGLSSHRCTRKANRDGWCTQHHPDAKKAREAERDARYAHEREVSRRRYAREAAAANALALLPTIPLIHVEACEMGPRHPDRACTCWVAKAEAILESVKR